jgi:hypothetical protein
MRGVPCVGVDVGTSSTKVVVGDASSGDLGSMGFVPLHGDWRWPSVVSVPEVRGDITVFSDGRFSPSAPRARRNLKLALLLPDEHPEVHVVRDHTGWDVDTLYGSLVAVALAKALRICGSPGDFALFVGAPLGDGGDGDRSGRFGRIAYAARHVAPLLSNEDLHELRVPSRVAEEMERQLHASRKSGNALDDVVLAESHAAVSGTAIAMSGLGGQNCVIDIGAGTADFGWFAPRGQRNLDYFFGDSFELAGEAIDELFRQCIERAHGVRVSRHELWAAKARCAVGEPLRGSNWLLPPGDVAELCAAYAACLVKSLSRASASVDVAERVRFLLVGGATLFAPLERAVSEGIAARFPRSEVIAVPPTPIPPIDGVGSAIASAPLLVAAGLARGIQAAQHFGRTASVPEEVSVPVVSRRTPCSCGGTNDDCSRCAGAGFITVGDRESTVARQLDTFEVRDGWQACHYCGRSVAPDLLDDHITRLHVKVLPKNPGPDSNEATDMSQAVIEWVRSPSARDAAGPLCCNLLGLLDSPAPSPAEARSKLASLRLPAHGGISATTQAVRALRALVWQRSGCPDEARNEADMVRWPELRRYLSDQGIDL